VTAVAVCLFFACPASQEISAQAYEQVKEGMTLREVELLVGGPPGCYGDFVVFQIETMNEEWAGEKAWSMKWLTEDGFLLIGFTADGRACSKFFVFGSRYPRERNAFDRWRLYLFRRIFGG
jgi:hypothetical protein